MGAVAWAGVKSTGHGPYPPQTSSGGIPSVLVNGKPIHVVGDSYSVHQKPPKNPNPHPGTLSKGSSTVFAGGKSVGRIGDSVSCGGSCAEGSANVIAG